MTEKEKFDQWVKSKKKLINLCFTLKDHINSKPFCGGSEEIYRELNEICQLLDEHEHCNIKIGCTSVSFKKHNCQDYGEVF